jgi:hypothetical protein
LPRDDVATEPTPFTFAVRDSASAESDRYTATFDVPEKSR